MPLELETLLRLGRVERGLELGLHHGDRGRVQVGEEIARGAGLRRGEQAVVEPHFGAMRAPGAHPVDIALDLVVVGRRRARARVRVVRGVHHAVLHAGALHHVAEAQAHLVARE